MDIVKSIELEIGGVTIKVTPEEVKNLHEALSKLLNLEDKNSGKHIKYVPYTPYGQPIWIWNPNKIMVGDYPDDKYKITYTTSNQTVNLGI